MSWAGTFEGMTGARRAAGVLLLAALLLLTGCAHGQQSAQAAETIEEVQTMQMNVTVGGAVFTAALEENEGARAFLELLEAGPVVIEMSDYAGFEKVGPLGATLPAQDSPTTTQPGDIVLYCADQIVMFYGSNSWSYTRLGHIDDLTGWAEALGSGDVTVIFSLD